MQDSRIAVLPVDLSTTGAAVDQLPFWLGVQPGLVPLEHSLLLAQRSGICRKVYRKNKEGFLVLPQLWAAAATSDALRLAATSKSYRRFVPLAKNRKI